MIILLFVYFNLIVGISNYNDWEYGLNNTKIENDAKNNGCQIQIPKICLYKILDIFQDYSKLNRKKCESYRFKTEKENLIKDSSSSFISKSSNRIGYPLTNKDPICMINFKGDE